MNGPKGIIWNQTFGSGGGILKFFGKKWAPPTRFGQ
jgi:hypothetical protein